MRQTEYPSAFFTLMAGGFAGTFSWVLSIPFDVVKSRLQVDGMDGKPKYLNAVDCMKKSYNDEGMKFFTRGLTSTLLRAFPMNAVCFYVVSYVLKAFENPKNINVTIPMPETLAIVETYRRPSFMMRVVNRAQNEVHRHKTAKYMIYLDGFHEASCHVEMMDLSDQLRERRHTESYFFRTSDGLVDENLSDEEMRTPMIAD